MKLHVRKIRATDVREGDLLEQATQRCVDVYHEQKIAPGKDGRTRLWLVF